MSRISFYFLALMQVVMITGFMDPALQYPVLLITICLFGLTSMVVDLIMYMKKKKP